MPDPAKASLRMLPKVHAPNQSLRGISKKSSFRPPARACFILCRTTVCLSFYRAPLLVWPISEESSSSDPEFTWLFKQARSSLQEVAPESTFGIGVTVFFLGDGRLRSDVQASKSVDNQKEERTICRKRGNMPSKEALLCQELKPVKRCTIYASSTDQESFCLHNFSCSSSGPRVEADVISRSHPTET